MRSLAVLVLAISSTASAGPCAVRPLRAEVLTPPGALVAPGGGFVVAHVPDLGEGGDPGDDWASWHPRGEPVPTIKSIAPGLDVIDIGRAHDEVWLEDGANTAMLAAIVVDKVAELAAPVVRGVASATGGMARRPTTTVVVDLGAKVPAHAVALVAFGSDGTPRSFGLVKPGETGAVIYASGSCQAQPANVVITRGGDEIQLAWLAESGRLSKKSAKIKVSARGH